MVSAARNLHRFRGDSQLSTSRRTVVTMRHYEEHRVAEIATRLRITPNAVKLRLLRAHRELRRRLMERGCLIAAG